MNKYVINRDTYLPARFSGLGNVSVRYSSYDENGDKTFPADDSVTDEEVVYFVPTTSTVKLKAKITEGAATIEKDFDMTSSNTVTVRSAVTVANNLLTRWYGHRNYGYRKRRRNVRVLGRIRSRFRGVSAAI